MQKLGEAAVVFQFVLDDGDEDVRADSDPDLGLHGIRRVAEEGLDAKELFNPFEEEFDLPAGIIKLGDRDSVWS